MRREWTASEEIVMRSRYQYQTVQKTAQMLNRSVYSVKRKAVQMGLSHYNDKLSAKAVSQAFNTEISAVKRWIEKFGLPAKKVNHGTYYTYYIDTQDFWEWAEGHKDIINWSKYEFSILCNEKQVGHIFLNELMTGGYLVEWIEIFPEYRKKGYCKQVLMDMMDYLEIDEIQLEASEELISMYLFLGAEKLAYDDIREMYLLRLRKQ